MANAAIKHLTSNACGECPALKTICSGRSYMRDNCIAFTKRLTRLIHAQPQENAERAENSVSVARELGTANKMQAEIAALERFLAAAINECSWSDVRIVGVKLRQLSAMH